MRYALEEARVALHSEVDAQVDVQVDVPADAVMEAGRDLQAGAGAALAAAEQRVVQLLDELAAAGWLSDERAAESLVAVRSSRYGVSRLRQMLAERGVDRDAADAALEAARATELQRAHEVWRRRFGESAEDAAGRARQQRFLLSRGFAPSVVRQVTGGDFDPGDDAVQL